MRIDPADLDAIRDALLNLGAHPGPCDTQGPSGGCSLHLRVFNARRKDALAALERVGTAVAER